MCSVSETNKFDETPCNHNKDENVPMIWGDFSASSQFFVAIGVIGMLYAGASLAMYVFMDSAYRTNPRIAQYDFLISVGITCFSLLSTAAWCSGVSDLKFYTDPTRVLKEIDFCYNNVTKQVNSNKCKLEDDLPDYAALHVSLVSVTLCS